MNLRYLRYLRYLSAIPKVEFCASYLNMRIGMDIIDKILVCFTCAKILHKKVAPF